ncbi:MAG: hypothetical protein DA405_12380 [Bacteroidetes bacterium]|nr:MAG: hypothetical protein DA405_12380 [Bacteroidota bacterium]
MKYFFLFIAFLVGNFLNAQARLDCIIKDFILESIEECPKLKGIPYFISVRVLQNNEDTILEIDLVYSRYRTRYVEGEAFGCINEVPVYFINDINDPSFLVTIDYCSSLKAPQNYDFGLLYTKASDTLTYIGRGMPNLSQRIFVLDSADWKLISEDLTPFIFYLRKDQELRKLGWSAH